MAGGNTLGNLVQYITGDYTGLSTALNKSETETKKAADNMTSSLKKVGDTFTKVGKTLTLGLTLPIIGLGAAALKSVGQFQLYQASFETMLGSAEKAKVLIGDLQTLAAATPFQFDDLANAGKTLLQFGVELEDVLPTVRQLGDIAQGDSEKFKSLSLAFGQIQSTGRLMGQDLLQLINAGFNPLQIIAEKTGETIAELKDRMSEGAISAEEIADAFATATDEGGPFFQGMEKASKTLPGLISTLKDNIVTLGRSFAEIIVPAVTDIVLKLSEFAKKITELDEGTKKAILTFLGIAAAVGPVLLFVGAVVKAFQAIQTMIATIKTLQASMAVLGISGGPVFLAVAAITALVAVTAGLIINHRKLQEQRIEETYGDIASAAGLATRDIQRLESAFAELNRETTEEGAREYIERLSEATGIAKDELARMAVASGRVNGVAAEVLDKIIAQGDAMRELTRETRTSQELMAIAEENARGVQAAIEAQVVALEEALRIEQERVKEVVDSRLAAEQKTRDAIAATQRQVSIGLLTQEEANDRILQLYEQELIKLTEIGYTLESGGEFGQRRIEALQNEIKEIENVDDRRRESDELQRDSVESKIEDLTTIDEKEEDNHQKKLDRIKEEMSKAIEAHQLIYGSLTAVFTQYYANELSTLKKNREEGKITEKEYAKETAKIQQKQFRLNQATSAINATISGAGAAIKAYEQLGPIGGSIAAVLIGGLTATQVGLILTQEPPPIPQFAEGALTGVNKPLTAVVGDNKKYPEVVAPLSPEVFGMIANGIVNALSSRAESGNGRRINNVDQGVSGGGSQNGRPVYVTQNNLLNLDSSEGLQKAAQAMYPYIEDERARRG